MLGMIATDPVQRHALCMLYHNQGTHHYVDAMHCSLLTTTCDGRPYGILTIRRHRVHKVA